jgi:glycosyltransferase involved in cell wall biosynthesis
MINTGETLMRILYITDYLPDPPISGDSIRVFNLIKRISTHHRVSLVALFAQPGTFADSSVMNEFCERVVIINHQWPSLLSSLPNMLMYFLQGIPVELRLLYSKTLANTILRLTNEEQFDMVHIEHSRMALYLDELSRRQNHRTLLTFHNIAFDQFKRISLVEKKSVGRLRTWLHGEMMRRWEPRYAERFDRCITVSELDRQILLAANPRLAVEVVSNGIDTVKYQVLEDDGHSPSILFVGSMGYSPCADGAVYFCGQILPHIEQRIGKIDVWIVGANPPPAVIGLDRGNVHVTGYVEDVLPYYRRTAVSIVPLRAGGGTRLKILESMALGRPVVSTSIGCEGLDLVDGKHLFVADDPEEFADKTVRLLQDRPLRRQIAVDARRFVEARYDWNTIADHLLRVYSGMN